MADTTASAPKGENPGPAEAATSAKEAVKSDPKGQNTTASFLRRLKEENHGPVGEAAASESANPKKSEAGEGPRDHNENVSGDGERTEEYRGGRKPRGGGNWKPKRGRGNWRDNSRRGGDWDQHDGNRGSHYHSQGYNSHPYNNRRRGGGFQQREQRMAEELQRASLAQKDDKVVSFDCRVRPKSELTDWLRQNKPTALKRSDKIGYIAVISKRCTSLTEKKFTMTTEDLLEIHSELIADWERLTEDPSAKITYDTVMQLAKKHKVLGGKWLCNFEHGVDDTWVYLASAVAATDNPMPCLAVKITPVNDVGDTNFGRRSHMCSVYTEDFTDMDNVFAVEKCLRAVPIRKDLTYKPDIFTALGIYRNNKYNLKPVIYHSVWHSMSSTSVTDSVFDMDWSYQGGSGDLREVKTESRKQAKKDKQTMEELESMIDSVIDRVLGKTDDPPSDAQTADQPEGATEEGEKPAELTTADQPNPSKESEAKEAKDEVKEDVQATGDQPDPSKESETREAKDEVKGDVQATGDQPDPSKNDAKTEVKKEEGEKPVEQATADQPDPSKESEAKEAQDEVKEDVQATADQPEPFKDDAETEVKKRQGEETVEPIPDGSKAEKKEKAAAKETAAVPKTTVDSLVDTMVKTNIAEMAVGESGVVEIPPETNKNIKEE